MKINFKVRGRNPVYWLMVVLSLVLPVLAYGGTELSSLTTWPAAWDAIVGTISNPYACLTVLLSLTGATIDPTSAGWTDSLHALDYQVPAGSKQDEIQRLRDKLKELEGEDDD